MARTVDEIYDSLIAQKESNSDLAPLLPDPETASQLQSKLSSGSKVAGWRLFLKVVAWGIRQHELVFDDHKTDIKKFADTLIGGTTRWLQRQCFLFQLGDVLVYNTDTNKFSYLSDNPTAQIIKRAAVLEAGGQLRIKVAKEDGGGDPEKLGTSELSAFQTYISQIKFAGTNVIVTSNDADELQINYEVFYDPILMQANGSLVSDGSTFPVEDAINDYIENLPFNGVLNLTELTDVVQQAVGVKDPRLSSALARFGSNPFTSITREYVADAGYMKVDPGTPLSGTITYTPEPN